MSDTGIRIVDPSLLERLDLPIRDALREIVDHYKALVDSVRMNEQPGFLARLNKDFTTPSPGAHYIPFDREVKNPYGEFNPSNGTFTALRPGELYLVYAKIYSSYSENGKIALMDLMDVDAASIQERMYQNRVYDSSGSGTVSMISGFAMFRPTANRRYGLRYNSSTSSNWTAYGNSDPTSFGAIYIGG